MRAQSPRSQCSFARGRETRRMNAITRMSVALLLITVLLSAVGVIWSKHRARGLFVESQTLEEERDRLNIEWGQLTLEQSAWSMHGRVEQVARQRLRMTTPQPNEVRIVEP